MESDTTDNGIAPLEPAAVFTADEWAARMDRPNQEPVLTANGLQSVIAAALVLLVTLGVPVSDDTKLAILGLGGALYSLIAPLVAAYVARKRVTPV